MAQPTIAEIRKAIATQLRTFFPDMNVYEVWPDNIETPAMLLRPSSRKQEAFGNGLEIMWDIEILMDSTAVDDGQRVLDEYIDEDGDRSIRNALEADPSLGGVVENSCYYGWSKYGGKQTESIVFIGVVCEFGVYV